MSRSALLVSAAVALGNPVDSCRRILHLEAPPEPAYGAPPVAVYGGPPPTVLVPTPDAGALPEVDAGSDAAPRDARASNDASAPPPRDAGAVRVLPKPAYGGPPPRGH
jgi:hypothetical protein